MGMRLKNIPGKYDFSCAPRFQTLVALQYLLGSTINPPLGGKGYQKFEHHKTLKGVIGRKKAYPITPREHRRTVTGPQEL